jgi:hypothetical protein
LAQLPTFALSSASFFCGNSSMDTKITTLSAVLPILPTPLISHLNLGFQIENCVRNVDLWTGDITIAGIFKLPVIVKASSSPYASRRLHHEGDAYRDLSSLQSHSIPKFYGLYQTGRYTLLVMSHEGAVLENFGDLGTKQR